MQKALLVRKNGVIVAKAVFAGDIETGIANAKLAWDAKNSPASLEYEEFETDQDQDFIDAIIDTNEPFEN